MGGVVVGAEVQAEAGGEGEFFGEREAGVAVGLEGEGGVDIVGEQVGRAGDDGVRAAREVGEAVAGEGGPTRVEITGVGGVDFVAAAGDAFPA